MSTLGSLSIGKMSTPWSKSDTDVYLMSVAVGVLAGIAVTYLRTPFHMPGHKALLWIIPALSCRMVTRAKGGATSSVLGTIVATLLLGGELGGGNAFMMPLVGVAGFTLDVAVRRVESHTLPLHFALPLLALAGLAGNLICFLKRLFDTTGQIFGSGCVQDLLSAAIFHAIFGLIAGLCGAVIGIGILKYRALAKSRAAAH